MRNCLCQAWNRLLIRWMKNTKELISTLFRSNRRKPSTSVTSTTPAWNIITPEPPTTPDPGSGNCPQT